MNYAVIMAGGAGTRFWPLSTEDKPKQFLDILGTGKTFLQMTADRFLPILPAENIYIVTNEKYRGLVTEQLPYLQEHQIIAEPSRNNTAPCILLAALKIQKSDPDACCVFVPSDHLIIDSPSYQQDILTALAAAKAQSIIVTIGVRPNRPETGYGYIKLGAKASNHLYRVDQFVEKPNLDTATFYLASGNYLWNAGMFAWHVNTIESEYQQLCHNLYESLTAGRTYLNTDKETSFLKIHYPKTENISVDFAIMEKSTSVYTLPANFDWSDLGIWSSVYEASHKDNDQNANNESFLTLRNSSGNLIHLPKNKKALIRGIHDMIIVDSGTALLIYPKSYEQEIKQDIQAQMNQ
jgi:mannose-1-phosphate guanylyltransferase